MTLASHEEPTDPADMAALLRAACNDAIGPGRRFATMAELVRALAAQEGQLERTAHASLGRSLNRPNAAASTVRAVCRLLGLRVALVPLQPRP